MDYFLAMLSSPQGNIIYKFVSFYVGAYPIFGVILWMTTSLFFYKRRESNSVTPLIEVSSYFPPISIVISAYNEEKNIATSIESVCKINYPNYEIVVINDGSRDKTKEILEQYVTAGKIRLISKNINEGKAMAINDAMLCLTGEIIVVLDADAEPDSALLYHLVKHFQNARVAAVAGHPRVKNVDNFLCRMQFLEYVSVIGMIRRSQRVWGRIMAFSGVVFAVRRTAFFDVGGFSPASATEDTDLTWKLQRRFWDVFYEPKAITWVIVPTTYKAFFRQRLRWSRGLMHVMHRYIDSLWKWKMRRMWPMFLENLCSTLWALCIVILLGFWVFAFIFGIPMEGAGLIPSTWGITIATLSLILAGFSLFLDKKYDSHIIKYYFYAVYYPIYYWILLAIIAVIALPALFIKPKLASKWQTER